MARVTTTGPRTLTAEEIAAHLAAAKAAAHADTKEQARQRIVAVVPEWRQSNLNGRMNELNKARADRMADGVPIAGVGGDFWTDDERAEVAAMSTLFDWIKAVRAASDTIEADVDALADVAAVAAWVVAMPSDARWPA